MKVLLLLVAFLFPVSVRAECQLIQWSVNGTIQPWTQKFITEFSEIASYNPVGYYFPYTVPEGKYVGLTDFHFASKNIFNSGTHRNNYMILWSTITITEQAPSIHTTVPYMLAPGFVLDGAFSNASAEAQNMNGWVAGYLSDDPTLANCVRF